MSKPSGAGEYLLIQDNGIEGNSVSRHRDMKEIQEAIQNGQVHSPFIIAREIPFVIQGIS